MKSGYLLLLGFSLVLSTSVFSQSDAEVLAKRGKGIVTQATFTARANKIPEDIRLRTLRDGNRLNDVITNLLLRAQLAADAREAGFDNQDVVKERMRLAADAELGEAWLTHYVEIQPEADYEALAREYYQLNQDSMLSPKKIDVSHILISAKDHPEEEALEIANKVSQEVKEDPASFDDLVSKYSEDPSKSSNHGKFVGIGKGEMIKQFEDVAFALAEGEISEPVRTKYGYHIIRLDAHLPRTKRTFKEVKMQLMQSERKRHESRIKNNYLSGLTALSVEMSEEALKEMVRRQFGDEAVGQSDESAQPE